MSLLDDSDQTPEQRTAKQVRFAIRSTALEAVDAVKQIHTQIWMQDGVDPQDVFNQFTTHGADYLSARDAMVTFITEIATANDQTLADYITPEWYEPPAGKSLTVNVDGSITVEDV